VGWWRSSKRGVLVSVYGPLDFDSCYGRCSIAFMGTVPGSEHKRERGFGGISNSDNLA
jgi:hypothetical protein